MPLYEYRCERCDEHFEELVRIDTPDEEVECPTCGEHEAKRKVSVIGAIGGMSAGGGGGSSCGGSSGFG